MLTDIVAKNCQNIYRRAGLYLFFLVLLVAVAAFSAFSLPLETSLESMVLEDDPDLLFYQKFKQQFGEDEFLVVGFSAADVFAPEILQFIREQTARLEALPEVREVVSLTNVDEFVGADCTGQCSLLPGLDLGAAASGWGFLKPGDCDPVAVDDGRLCISS